MKRARKIRSIPISAIKITNPRDRFEEPFIEMVRSIVRVGLKRPITVSDRDGLGQYELVCGQGRIEAFAKLKATEIPAIVTNVETEDCILLSLVENIARRQHSPVESVSDIGRLAESYDTSEIATKLGVPTQYVQAVRYLLRNGHHNLIKALERRAVTPTMAFEIARANTPQLQAALLKLYKGEKRSVAEIAKIRKLFEQQTRGTGKRVEKDVTPGGLVRVYRQEIDRHKTVTRKAELVQMRLVFIVNALRSLLDERMFVSLLRDEGLDKIPLPLLRKLSTTRPEVQSR